jgi:hypothetical protein
MTCLYRNSLQTSNREALLGPVVDLLRGDKLNVARD